MCWYQGCLNGNKNVLSNSMDILNYRDVRIKTLLLYYMTNHTITTCSYFTWQRFPKFISWLSANI